MLRGYSPPQYATTRTTFESTGIENKHPHDIPVVTIETISPGSPATESGSLFLFLSPLPRIAAAAFSLSRLHHRPFVRIIMPIQVTFVKGILRNSGISLQSQWGGRGQRGDICRGDIRPAHVRICVGPGFPGWQGTLYRRVWQEGPARWRGGVLSPRQRICPRGRGKSVLRWVNSHRADVVNYEPLTADNEKNVLTVTRGAGYSSDSANGKTEDVFGARRAQETLGIG